MLRTLTICLAVCTECCRKRSFFLVDAIEIDRQQDPHDRDEAEPIDERKAEAKECKQRARRGWVTDVTIQPALHDPMIREDGHVGRAQPSQLGDGGGAQRNAQSHQIRTRPLAAVRRRAWLRKAHAH